MVFRGPVSIFIVVLGGMGTWGALWFCSRGLGFDIEPLVLKTR